MRICLLISAVKAKRMQRKKWKWGCDNFEPNSGVLNANLYYGKAIDNRIGCFALIKIMEN